MDLRDAHDQIGIGIVVVPVERISDSDKEKSGTAWYRHDVRKGRVRYLKVLGNVCGNAAK